MSNIQKTIQTIQNNIDSINKENGKIVSEYVNIRENIDDVSPSTIRTDIQGIYQLCIFLEDKKLGEVKQDDLIEWIKWLKKKFKGGTSAIYKIKIKQFYKYLSDKEKYKKGYQKTIPYPDTVNWITTTNKDEDELPIDVILNQKQIKKILNSCRDAREQGIIVTLLDGGLRSQELRNLKLRSVGFDDKLGAYFILPKNGKYKTKKSQRKVQLFLIPSSTAYIRDYLNHHMYKSNPDAPLFYTMDTGVYTSILKRINKKEDTPEDWEKLKLTDIGLWNIINRIIKRSGINVKISPHTLRHNSATMCSRMGFNEFMLRERFGWKNSSVMPSRYSHLASRDTNSFIKKKLGIEDEEESEQNKELQPILCWNCEFENPCTNNFCGRCSANLNPKKEEITPTATETGIATQEMLKDPKFREFYNDMLAMTWEKYAKMKEKQETN